MEISTKFTVDSIREELGAVAFEVVRTWTDAARRLRRDPRAQAATADGAPLRCGRARVRRRPARPARPAWSHGARHRSRVTRRDRLRLRPAAGVARGLGRRAPPPTERVHDRVPPSSAGWASRRWVWWPT